MGRQRIQGSIAKRFTNGNLFSTIKRRPKRRGAAEAMDGRSSVHVMEDMVAF